MEALALFGGWVVVIGIGLIFLAVILRIYGRKMNIDSMLQEDDRKASFSRFQFMIFTFVISMCVLVLTLESGHFPTIETNVLGLLGISGGSYVISKGISEANKDKGKDVGSADEEATGEHK